MNKRKRFLIIVLEIIVIMVMGYRIYCDRKSKLSQFMYEDYKITVADNEYDEKTHIGILKLEIQQCGGETEKLFPVSDDLFQSRSGIVVDEDFFDIRGQKYSYAKVSFETKYKDKTQHITTYYINQDTYGTIGDIRLVINDKQKAGEVFEAAIGLKKKEEGNVYICRNQKIYVTGKGLMLDTSAVPEMYDSVSMKNGFIELQWEDQCADIALSVVTDLPDYDEKKIIEPKLSWTKSKAKHYYVVELDGWEDIEEIRIGSYVFEKSSMK